MKRILVLCAMLLFLHAKEVPSAIILSVGDSGFLPMTDTNLSSYNIAINQFDPSLGVLTGITLTFEIFFDSHSTYKNTRNWDANLRQWEIATVGLSDGIWVSAPGSSSNMTTSGNYSLLKVGSDPTGYSFTNFPEYGSLYKERIAPYGYGGYSLSFNEAGLFAVGNFSPFLGLEKINFYLGGSEAWAYGDGPSIEMIQHDSKIRGIVTADYRYNQVPIPGSVWLLGAGLMGIAGIRMRIYRRHIA